MEVTLNLPENVYRNFQEIAEKTKRRVDEVIAEKIQAEYLIENTENEKVLAHLADEEVLELANLKLSKQQDKRLSNLLEKQRESRITTNEKVELEGLMELYRMGTIRKAQGCLEAVKRGLIKTPTDLK